MDWMLVRNGTPDAICKQIAEYSATTDHSGITFRLDVTPVAGGYAVTATPKLSPYWFVNLMFWLHRPPDCNEVGDAVGWMTAPATGTRYLLDPAAGNGGDSLVGVGEGTDDVISVWVPALWICPISDRISVSRGTGEFPAGAEPVRSIEAAFDHPGMNADFSITHAPDTDWLRADPPDGWTWD